MTALRTTRPITPGPTRSLLRGAASVIVLGLFGCGMPSPPTSSDSSQSIANPGNNDPAWLTSREKLPAPHLDRLDYDAEKRTLALYDLTGRDQWMVQLPNEAVGHPIGPMHRLPEGVDTSRTLIYYARPGVKVSAPVSVAAIEAGRRDHSSSLATNR